jgi:hypothetical protein
MVWDKTSSASVFISGVLGLLVVILLALLAILFCYRQRLKHLNSKAKDPEIAVQYTPCEIPTL